MDDRKNYILLMNLICSKYGLDPKVKTNLTNVRAFLINLDRHSIAERYTTLDEANQYIVDLYGETIKANTRDIVADLNYVKDYMVKQINTPGDEAKIAGEAFTNKRKERLTNDSGVGGILDMAPEKRIAAIRYLNYQSLFRDEYIVIDSRYRNLANPDMTKVDFSLIMNTKIRGDHGGIIVGNTLQDIVEIEIYPFTMPYKPVYATFYNKITLTVNEWTSNSFEAYEGGQFHFEFDIDSIDNNLIYLRPINNKYTFSIPMNKIDSFSLSFGAVYPKITFDPDRMYTSSISFTDPLGIFSFSEPHNLVTGDLVYITGFTTPDPSLDVDMISTVNRAEGHVIVKKNNYSFIINVDLTAVRHEIPTGSNIYPIDVFPQLVLVYFASKRIQIQMRLSYLTNYA
jgi:hypothetical protein